jgi:hypothetical protein
LAYYPIEQVESLIKYSVEHEDVELPQHFRQLQNAVITLAAEVVRLGRENKELKRKVDDAVADARGALNRVRAGRG